jgi:hypothetical protein
MQEFLIQGSLTTAAAAIPAELGVRQTRAGVAAENRVLHLYWRPIHSQQRPSGFNETGTTGLNIFFHNTVLTTPTSISVVSATDQSVDYASHEPGAMITRRVKLRTLDLPRVALSQNTVTFLGWEAVPTLPAELARGLTGIETVIADLRLGKPILRSATLMRLAERAAAPQPLRTADLESWANRLADDVKDATD